MLDDWASQSPRLAVIHGRRRLGKTSLLRQWCRRAPCCYVLATEGTAASQRAAFAEDLAAVVPGFGEVTYPTWRALFRSLVAQWPRDGKRPTILAIDDPRDIMEAYAAWGGVPRYWELAARQKGALWDAVTSLVLSPSGVLHEVASRVLRDEEAATLERAQEHGARVGRRLRFIGSSNRDAGRVQMATQSIQAES